MAVAAGYLDAAPVAQVRTRRRTRSRRCFALLAALVAMAGVVVTLSPLGPLGEERFGAHWLFAARGDVPPPDDVVLVDIDRASARALGEGDRPRLWSRRRHAELVQALHQAGASVVGFDLVWPDPHAVDEDAAFAAAVADAGNVVLVGELDREPTPVAGLVHERLTPPAAGIGRGARAVVPWPLPQAGAHVASFWTFKASAGDLPTLPAMMLFVHFADQLPALGRVVETLDAPLGHAFAKLLTDDVPPKRAARDLRDRFAHHGVDAGALHAAIDRNTHDVDTRRALHALANLLAGPATRQFNLYGRPRSIRTVAYADVVCDCDSALLASLHGKAVFVGVAAPHQPVLGDVFETAFTAADGGRLSGVELGAMAFANLVEARTLESAPWPVAATFVLLAGVLIAAIAWYLPVGWLVIGAAAVATAVFAVAQWLFGHAAVQLPVTVPLLLQLPLGLGLGLALRYRHTRIERGAMRRALGYYLPDRVAESVGDTVDDLGELDELVHCVCLSSDAANFTRATEAMTPTEAKAFVNAYYAELFAAVRAHGGFVSDVVGDAMLALWPSNGPNAGLHLDACLAALEIERRVRAARSLGGGFETRIGLHCGKVMLGHVGAGEHFEFRAVGDIVNTTSRIEALNKRFATRALASANVVAKQPQLLTRRLGCFALRGKREALELHELVAERANATPAQLQHCAEYEAALDALLRGDTSACLARTRALLDRHPDDRPAHALYALATGAGDGACLRDGVIHLTD